MSTYLFVHFKERRTPDGEQVYFSVSKDAFRWETVNNGNPVLWSYLGDKGVRDCTIARTETGRIVLLGTDLSLAYGMRNQYQDSWENISRHGSKCLCFWESRDLVSWSRQQLVKLGDESFGCLWAPDILYDKINQDYIVHWSSSHARNGFGDKAIFYARTKDFTHFSAPALLYKREDCGVIDSAMYEENGRYYLFVKCEKSAQKPVKILLLESDSITGPFHEVEAFQNSMRALENGDYEAPTAVKLEDGRWCLFLDYYGCQGEGQGYVPFLSDNIATGVFTRADDRFSFPYTFKHGTILKISDDEYLRLKAYTKGSTEY